MILHISAAASSVCLEMELQVLLLLVGTLVCCGRGQSPVEIHIAFITSFDGEYDSSVTVPAVQLATQQVNSDPILLPGHKLVVELIDNITIARNFANSQVKAVIGKNCMHTSFFIVP